MSTNKQEQIDVCALFGVSVTIHGIHYRLDTKNNFRITEVSSGIQCQLQKLIVSHIMTFSFGIHKKPHSMDTNIL